MQLSTEDLDPIDDVTQAQIEEILASDVFGKFVILSQSDTAYIQAASDWQPTDECKEFMRANDSDPWFLEFHDNETDTHYRAEAYKTLDSVVAAFKSYLANDGLWRSSIDWQVVKI